VWAKAWEEGQAMTLEEAERRGRPVLREKILTREHAGEPLSRYEVQFLPGTEKPRSLARPKLFETSHALPQLRLFRLDALGEAG
jgi:hypothetical protein